MTRGTRLLFRVVGIALIVIGEILAIIDKDPMPFQQPCDTILIGLIALVISFGKDKT